MCCHDRSLSCVKRSTHTHRVGQLCREEYRFCLLAPHRPFRFLSVLWCDGASSSPSLSARPERKRERERQDKAQRHKRRQATPSVARRGRTTTLNIRWHRRSYRVLRISPFFFFCTRRKTIAASPLGDSKHAL